MKAAEIAHYAFYTVDTNLTFCACYTKPDKVQFQLCALCSSDIWSLSQAKQTTPQGVVSSTVLRLVADFLPYNSIDGVTIGQCLLQYRHLLN